MPNRQKEKGDRAERLLVRVVSGWPNLSAEKVPLSGAVGGIFSGDVVISTPAGNKRIEVKDRASGFSKLYAWLEPEDIDALVIKQTGKAFLVVMGITDYLDLLRSQVSEQEPIYQYEDEDFDDVEYPSGDSW